MLASGQLGIAGLGRALNAAEVGLHRALEATVLVPLAVGAVDALDL